MPAVGFVKLGTGEALSFEDAPDWYEQNTEIPSEVIRLIAALEGDPRRLGINLSPSSLSPVLTCRRALLIKKFLPYLINGCSEWMANEGTILHDAFNTITPKKEDEWYREVLLPDLFIDKAYSTKMGIEGVYLGDARVAQLVTQGVIRLFEYVPGVHQAWEVQIFPGIWVNGKLDKLHETYEKIEDFKTKRWNGYKNFKTGQQCIKHYPPDIDNFVQINAYRRMVKLLTGVDPTDMVIRRVYRGAAIAEEAWKKYPVEPMADGDLESHIREHVDTFVGWATEMRDIKREHEARGEDPIPALCEYLARVPLDGLDRRMLNDTKCTRYCTFMPICYDLAGKVRFETKPDECRLIKEIK